MRRLWADINRRFCLAESYLAEHRGEKAIAADWACRALHWQGEIDHIDIERRYSL